MNTFLSQLKKKSYSLKPKKSFNPHIHWRTLLGTFFVLVALLVLFSLYILFQIRNDKPFRPEPAVSANPVVLKENLLKSVMDSFAVKAQKNQSLIDTPPFYQDPSI